MNKYKFPFTNSLTFALVMQNEKYCRNIIERVLPEKKVREIRIKAHTGFDYEKTIIASIEAKSVRLDVVFEDDDTIYDIEMQVGDEHNIAKRSRYIHSALDVDELKRGESYNSLKANYVIFLCCFDYFSSGSAVYKFEMIDKKRLLPLGDECYTVIVNATSKDLDVSTELRNLLDYMMTENVADGDDILTQVDNDVEFYNSGKGLTKIMTLYEQMQYEYNKGLEQGVKQGEKKIISSMLNKGMTAEKIAEITGVSVEEIKLLISE